MKISDNGFLLLKPPILASVINPIIDLCSSQSVSNGHMPLDVRLSERVIDIGRQLGLSQPVRLAVGSKKICMHLPPMVRRVDPGDTSAMVPRHQDLAYNRHIQGPFITAWLTLTDIDDQCGGIAVYPSTVGLGELPREPEGQHWLGPVLMGPPGPGQHRIILKPPAGSVVLMTHDLVHESMPNTSDHPRYSIDYRFFAADVHSDKPSLLCE